MSPKEILNETYSKAGGLLQMSSAGEVGRNLRQIYNINVLKVVPLHLYQNVIKIWFMNC